MSQVYGATSIHGAGYEQAVLRRHPDRCRSENTSAGNSELKAFICEQRSPRSAAGPRNGHHALQGGKNLFVSTGSATGGRRRVRHSACSRHVNKPSQTFHSDNARYKSPTALKTRAATTKGWKNLKVGPGSGSGRCSTISLKPHQRTKPRSPGTSIPNVCFQKPCGACIHCGESSS